MDQEAHLHNWGWGVKVIVDVLDGGLVFHCVTCGAILSVDSDNYGKLTHPKRDCPYSLGEFQQPFVMDLVALGTISGPGVRG